ncbi:hypothetical protein ZOSMA_241G00320 [Zostera marina]|uniref:Uncharacterized protein n=1 Tax=Zostera marina TaxID=29655 RepID=A0A0K9PJ89_ZOSMR|nr:hypothetical protein ZOSMA_241G00320 [Zostera marina]
MENIIKMISGIFEGREALSACKEKVQDLLSYIVSLEGMDEKKSRALIILKIVIFV